MAKIDFCKERLSLAFLMPSKNLRQIQKLGGMGGGESHDFNILTLLYVYTYILDSRVPLRVIEHTYIYTPVGERVTLAGLGP